jgi:hypothetical protein
MGSQAREDSSGRCSLPVSRKAVDKKLVFAAAVALVVAVQAALMPAPKMEQALAMRARIVFRRSGYVTARWQSGFGYVGDEIRIAV